MTKVNLPHLSGDKEKESTTDKSTLVPEKAQNGMNSDSIQTGAQYLLSIAGMFSSDPNNSSENVESIVSDLIQKKFGITNGDISD